MKIRWPDKKVALLNEFLETFEAPSKRALYAAALRHFQSFFDERPLNESTLRTWLRTRSAKNPIFRAILSGRIADRFLEWLVERSIIPANPFAELRLKYECSSRSKAPMIRALVSKNPQPELEALRPAPRYASHLGPLMQAHVLRMRSLGHRYRHERQFLRFDRFLQARPNAAREPLRKLVHEYAASAASPSQKLQRLTLGNIVAKALTRSGVPTPPIPPERSLRRQVVRQRKGPYIYTKEQVALLLQTALSFPTRRAKLRPITLYTMVALAYCAGLRLSEIVQLTLKDIDLNEGIIEVCGTKFFKSRRLPISASAIEALQKYLEIRRKAGASLEPVARVFVHEGGGYSVVTAGKRLRTVIQRAGINGTNGRGAPRFHDLRHSFVVHRMIEWYEQGVNPQSRLPYLAAYLGHRDIHSTLVYLTITHELLQHANSRFRTAETAVLKVITGDSSNG